MSESPAPHSFARRRDFVSLQVDTGQPVHTLRVLLGAIGDEPLRPPLLRYAVEHVTIGLVVHQRYCVSARIRNARQIDHDDRPQPRVLREPTDKLVERFRPCKQNVSVTVQSYDLRRSVKRHEHQCYSGVLAHVRDGFHTAAGEVEHESVAADDELARLRADHPADGLVTVADNPDRARELATAARRLVNEGRAHLADRDDRAAAVVAARGAERAHPVIDSAETTLAEGGDLLGALAELTTAEQAIDDALAEHRDADDQRRRAHTRLERRVRNAEAFVAGVDRRLASSVAGTADNRSAISRAGHLVEEARTHLTDDPEAATLRLDEAMALAQAIQAELDEATREATARYYAEDRHRSGSVAEMTVDALAAGLIGLLSLGWGGSSSGGSSSGASGFGGGGRF